MSPKKAQGVHKYQSQRTYYHPDFLKNGIVKEFICYRTSPAVLKQKDGTQGTGVAVAIYTHPDFQDVRTRMLKIGEELLKRGWTSRKPKAAKVTSSTSLKQNLQDILTAQPDRP